MDIDLYFEFDSSQLNKSRLEMQVPGIESIGLLVTLIYSIFAEIVFGTIKNLGVMSSVVIVH